MRSLIPSVAALLIAITMMSYSSLASVESCFRVDPSESEEWYTPLPEDFRREYSQDSANQEKQSWDEYWGWVKSFYGGNFFYQGWTDRAKGVTNVVKVGPARQRVIKEITAFGKDICKEWAKHSSVGRVRSSDLIRWGKVVERAKARDDGSGEELGRAIASIRMEYQKRVKPPAE